MNGILNKIGLEQLVLFILSLATVIAVLANLGAAFWASWLGLAIVGPVAVRWWNRRFALGTRRV